MSRILINQPEVSGSSVLVSWSHDIKKVSLFNVVFDNAGSCQTIGVDGGSKNVSVDSLVPGISYTVKVMALVGATWVSSEYKTIML